MKWKLKSVDKQTNNKFLNCYALNYEVEKEDGPHNYSYYVASRHSQNSLSSLTKDYAKVDGVIIPTVYIDDNNKIFFVFTKQFRPALNTFVYSVPAGLVDDDEDIEITAKREVEEEAGGIVYETEILSLSTPTSSGLSDECNAVVLAKVHEFKNQNLEEFEEINTFRIPLEEANDFIDSHFFAMQPKFVVKFLIEKYKNTNKI